MMAAIPFLRMVMIVIIIMRFIAAREREGCYAYEQGYTYNVFYRVFHDGLFMI